jgi:hypothetical protein
MRSVTARIAAIVLPALFVALGVAHTVHSHPADEASALHPTCTLCQFHAPAGAPGEIRAVGTDSGPGTVLHAASPAAHLPSAPSSINATRAPPALFAI